MTSKAEAREPERKDPTTQTRGVLRRDTVRVVSHPAVVDCSSKHGSSLTVIPLMDGDVVAGFEVRCACGASTLIECVYQSKETR